MLSEYLLNECVDNKEIENHPEIYKPGGHIYEKDEFWYKFMQIEEEEWGRRSTWWIFPAVAVESIWRSLGSQDILSMKSSCADLFQVHRKY